MKCVKFTVEVTQVGVNGKCIYFRVVRLTHVEILLCVYPTVGVTQIRGSLIFIDKYIHIYNISEK